MSWEADIIETRKAHLRAVFAECTHDWHLVVRDYLICFEAAQRAGDKRAMRFFATKLVTAYNAIGLGEKACRYRELAVLAQK